VHVDQFFLIRHNGGKLKKKTLWKKHYQALPQNNKAHFGKRLWESSAVQHIFTLLIGGKAQELRARSVIP
jgi:hypothetical protein